MPDFFPALPTEFGTVAAYIAVIVFLTALPFCVYKKKWPDTGGLFIMLLSAVGAAAGAKVAYLTILLPVDKLGALADDKGVLAVGGLATLSLALKEAITNWRKVTGI
jgi:hypothetical protein